MTGKEAANWIGCHPSHVRKLIRNGTLPATSKKLKDKRGKVFQIQYNIEKADAIRVGNMKSKNGIGWKRGRPRKNKRRSKK